MRELTLAVLCFMATAASSSEPRTGSLPMSDLSVIEAEFGDLRRYASAPDFWPSKPEVAGPVIQSLKEATVRVIGKTAGGREIIALEYGEKEEIDARTDNLASALKADIRNPDPTNIYPESFYGAKRRTKPVLAIQGGIHGGELTGTAAALNLCKIIETGNDLRGKSWPELQRLARASRIVIIPWLNRDGTERWPLANPEGSPQELYDRCTFGVASDGTKYEYLATKSLFPIPPEKTAFMGSYYNDAGVNLQYDFCMPDRQPETLAWMRYYLQERPDAVLVCHCNDGTLISAPPSDIPLGLQLQISRIGGALRQRLLKEGYGVGRLSWAQLPGLGKPGISQISACYHVAGALPLPCEFPSGTDGVGLTLGEMLDIGLIIFEEVLYYGHRDGFRTFELRDKVRRQ